LCLSFYLLNMTKSRLEAFSDGVIAIIITIMVLEMKVPHDTSWQALSKLTPVFLSYILSFIGLGIYWVNHHHLLHSIKKVHGRVLWANLNLLFWLSLVPFVTAWMGESNFAKEPVILYAVSCNCCGLAYFLLLLSIKKSHRDYPDMMELLRHQTHKGLLSNIAYLLALIFAFYYPIVSAVLFILVAGIWFIPDKDIEAALSRDI